MCRYLKLRKPVKTNNTCTAPWKHTHKHICESPAEMRSGFASVYYTAAPVSVFITTLSLFHINGLFGGFIASHKNLPDALKIDYVENAAI